jgi:serine/threonine-protein kinase RsbW
MGRVVAAGMTDTYELTVTADAANLASIAEFVIETTAAAGFDEQTSYAVQMAVDEACANIIEHAYRESDNGRIRLVCDIGDDGLTISIFDWGTPFEPDAIPRLDPTLPLEERSNRGMGMFFIDNLMDTVDYRFNTPDGNRLTLFKRKQRDE